MLIVLVDQVLDVLLCVCEVGLHFLERCEPGGGGGGGEGPGFVVDVRVHGLLCDVWVAAEDFGGWVLVFDALFGDVSRDSTRCLVGYFTKTKADAV